jgi:hypothetical protein
MDKADVIRISMEVGLINEAGDSYISIEDMQRFAALVAAAEREACANVCDSYDVAEDVCSSDTAEGIAIAIRARGQ